MPNPEMRYEWWNGPGHHVVRTKTKPVVIGPESYAAGFLKANDGPGHFELLPLRYKHDLKPQEIREIGIKP